MHFAPKTLFAAITLCSVVGATVPAVALPIIPDNSSFQVGGSVRAMGATTYASASDTFINTTGFDFGIENGSSYTYQTPGGTVRLGGTGSQFYTNMGFVVGTAGTATDIAAGTFPAGEFTGSSKAVNIPSLYTFVVNGNTLSFDFSTLTSVDRSTDTTANTQTVTASGLGIVHLTGYQDANATFAITATRTGTGVTTTFSSSVTSATDVPEPVSFALLGAGLVAAGLVRRRNAARA